MKLSELKVGQKAKISKVSPLDDTSKRLMELGFLNGEEVSVQHEGPIGHDPIAIEVRGSLIAIRRKEAANVEVEILK